VAPAAPASVTLLRYTINVNIYGPNDQWITSFNPPLTLCAPATAALTVETALISAAWTSLPTLFDAQQACASVADLNATLFDLAASGSAQPATGTIQAANYIVQPGDTLFHVALHFGVTVRALQSANDLATAQIYPGQQLLIPGGDVALPDLPPASTADYIVQSGDTLFRLALRFGVKVSALQAANKLNTPLLLAGQKLLIPGGTLALGVSPALNATTPTPAGTPVSPAVAPPPVTLPPISSVAGSARVPIVEYHYSGFYMSADVMMTTAWFDDQLQWLADNNFTTLTADQLLGVLDGAYTPPERSIVLSFDLGTPHYDNFANVIVPALRRYNMRAIFFVVLNAVNDDCSRNYVCWSSLRAWQSEGLVSVQSHGVSHPDYATLTFDQIRADAGLSKTTIEMQLGTPVTIFAYPYDSVPSTAASVLTALGYRAALAGNVSGDRSVRSGDSRRFDLPRYYPYSSESRYPLMLGSSLSFGEMILQAVDK
jgi:LysM repeat protein/peptidoglycan/xylan/chitin deacetylase (PgdA/CDA1 family)